MAAGDGLFPELLLCEGWLWWLPDKELKKTPFSEKSSGWKSLYYYMTSSEGVTLLSLYKKPTKTKRDKPVDEHKLVQYQLHKKTSVNIHQQFICEVIDPLRRSSYYAFDNEGRRDAFTFFLITQRRLPDQPIIGKLFKVKPVNSEDHRKIGARGSICRLHICKNGVSLAFEKSQGVVAQWPLNSIRNYGITRENQFQLEAGRRSPMGQGIYTFDTRNDDHERIFKCLDQHIHEAMQSALAKSREDKIYDEYCSLAQLVKDQSRRFHSTDLQRISAVNFNHGVLPPPSLSDINSMATSQWGEDNSLPESKLSDVENWLESSTSPRSSKQTSSVRLPGNGMATPPLVPSSSRPSIHKPVGRERSKTTEDPLSERSAQEVPGYMDMRSSVQSLHNLPDSMRNRARHRPLGRTEPRLAQLSMSSTSVSRSFDSPEGRSPATGGRTKLDSQSSVASPLSPSMRSLQSLARSNVSLATPPPTFYEAVDLPSYPAPTPPEDSRQELRLSAPLPEVVEGANPISLPPKRRRNKRSVGSCEDLTSLVRNSLVLANDQAHGYENAMFNQELLVNFEISGDHSQSMLPPTPEEPTPPGNINPHVAYDNASTKVLMANGLGGKQQTSTSNHKERPKNSLHYYLAEEITPPPPTEHSPRLDSTYLLSKESPVVSPGGDAIVVQRVTGTLPTQRHDSQLTPYHTTVLGPDHKVEDDVPPPIPDIPRPYLLRSYSAKEAVEADACIVPASTSVQLSASGSMPAPTADKAPAAADSQDAQRRSADSFMGRTLPEPVKAGEGEGHLPPNRSLSSTGSSAMTSQSGLYERLNEDSMLENVGAGQRTTVWHVSLDGEPLDNPLPEMDQPASREVALAQAVADFSNLEEEAAKHNSGSQSMHEIQDAEPYLLPAPNPPSVADIQLPLPPPDDQSDSEDERARPSIVLGSIRKIFGDFSKSRLRRTKSTDILDAGASSSSPVSSRPSTQSTRAKPSSRKSKSSKASSSKVSGEFDFINISAKTKQFSRNRTSAD